MAELKPTSIKVAVEVKNMAKALKSMQAAGINAAQAGKQLHDALLELEEATGSIELIYTSKSKYYHSWWIYKQFKNLKRWIQEISIN